MKYLLLLSLFTIAADSLAQSRKKVSPSVKNIVCDDPQVVDNFSKANNPKNWHEYIVGPTEVCNTREDPVVCTKERVYAILLNNASLIAPGVPNQTVSNCGLYIVNAPVIVNEFSVWGAIRIRTNDENKTVENFTIEGHTLHPGKVTHQIKQIGDVISLETRGVGNGKWPLLYANKLTAFTLWKPLHINLQRIVATRMNKSFMPSPPVAEARWIDKPSDTGESTANEQSKKVSCGFNWSAWNNATATDKASMQKVMVPDPEGGFISSLLQYINNEIKQGNKVQVARHDFYEKKQPGYVIYIEYPQPLHGDKGRIEVYEDLGKSFTFPPIAVVNNLCAIRPADDNKGIIREDGRQDYFMNNSMFFDRTYAQFLEKNKQAPISTSTSSNERLGAKSPEELAILLLKCLKTNDKTTWMRCMHPDDSAETDELSARRFDRHREALTAIGVTNWSAVQYSRLTYPLRPMGGDKIDPNKTIPFSKVEFTYKNPEFVGRIALGTYSFYDGKWLVWFSGYPEDCTMVRQSFR